MISVGELKKLLEYVPDDVMVYAYEGEMTGLVLRQGAYSTIGAKTGFIEAREQPESEPARIVEGPVSWFRQEQK